MTRHPTASHPATGASASRGSTTPLVAGFAAVILLLVAVVVDASAAQLARQRLDAVADGAALQGADLGAQGRDAYEGGLAGHDLALSRAAAERAVAGYLRDSGALREHPGLRATVRVEGERVVVVLVVGVELPFRVPGGPGYATVRAVGSAVVRPARRPTTAPVRQPGLAVAPGRAQGAHEREVVRLVVGVGPQQAGQPGDGGVGGALAQVAPGQGAVDLAREPGELLADVVGPVGVLAVGERPGVERRGRLEGGEDAAGVRDVVLDVLGGEGEETAGGTEEVVARVRAGRVEGDPEVGQGDRETVC